MRVCLLVTAIACLPAAAFAQGASEWGGALNKYTSGMAQMIANSSRSPPKLVGPDDRNVESLNRFLNDYNSTRSALEGTALGLRTSTQFAVDGLAATLLVSGVGVVPALVVKGAGQLAADHFMRQVDADTRVGVQRFLQGHKDDLVRALGADHGALGKMSNAEIAERLSRSTRIIADIERAAPDDADLRNFAKDATITVLKETQIASLQIAQGNADELMRVSKSFIDFKKSTQRALVEHEAVLSEVSSTVNELANTMQAVDKRLSALGRDQAVIGDFVFTQMPAEQKAAALRNGFMREKFECGPGQDNCESKTLKEDLLKRFDSEARLQKIAGYAAKSAQTLSDLSTIANNLNLGGDFAKAAEVGSIAANAAVAAASGNYLGAIASVSGIFASRQNPEEARFNALMGYLQQQFEVINTKLNAILENQQKIYEAVVGLSSQLTEVYKALDERLANIDFNVRRIAFAIGVDQWREWQDCFALYQYVTVESSKEFRYLDALDFKSVGDMLRVASVKDQSIIKCLTVAQGKPSSLLNPRWFGNFLDARLVAEFSPTELPPQMSQSQYFTKDLLRQYIEDYFSPLHSIVELYRQNQGLTQSQLASLLMLPDSTAATYEARIDAVKRSTDICVNIGYAKFRGGLRILCQGGDANDLAGRLLQTPMVLDGAVTIAQWLLCISRFADLRDPTKVAFLNANELLAHASSDVSRSGGRQIVQDSLLIVDAAVAGAGLLYSDVTAHAFLDVLLKSPEVNVERERARKNTRANAIRILGSNRILAQNVALVVLRQRYDRQKSLRLPPIQASAQIYGAAIEDANKPKRSSLDRTGELLNGLFGDDLEFRLSDEQGIEVRLDSLGMETAKESAGAVWVKIPGPATFESGHLSVNQRLVELLRLRDALIERLIDYDISGRLSAEDAERMATLIARAASSEARQREK